MSGLPFGFWPESSMLVHEILEKYYRVAMPRVFKDEGFTVIEWMHSPNHIMTVKVDIDTSEVFWAYLMNGKSECGKGWPSREAWSVATEIGGLGLVKHIELELD